MSVAQLPADRAAWGRKALQRACLGEEEQAATGAVQSGNCTARPGACSAE
ncbi:MAG TPA: hypothetical protein VNK04_22050 [Gemmataceae bacterium]|nr:hypothetical protein [Gemmataceae bacterium]